MPLITLKETYKNDAGTIIMPCAMRFSKYALDIYSALNPEKFPKALGVLYLYDECLRYIEEKHEQRIIHHMQPADLEFKREFTGNKVLLAFSGGLDSAYQALWLKQNYDVTLFHVKNMNYYTNGKEFQVVEEFAKTFGFPLVIAEFKQNTKGENKKFWRENSFKNTLLYSMMVDYCINNRIKYISSGDDLRLDIKDTVTGTNVADAYQVTTSFFNSLKSYCNIDYIGINGIKKPFEGENIHKGKRLKYMADNNAYDYFYSCVNPGRFNQSNHNRIEKKYNVKLEKWNCGVCRKCAYHSLLRHYYLHEEFPKEFIDFCWEKICNGADYEFFKPSLPMETRINNLFEY